ncbi:unnamed protein product, partial [Rotaria magnacalcarata]
DIETCVYDELILLLLHQMLNLEKLHLYLTVVKNSITVFKYVRKVSLFDEHPFEHEFFLRIVQSFSMMENLTVQLDLILTYKDYHAQFSLDTKTCLKFDVLVSMQHELLKKVTHNFRRNTTRELIYC